MKFLILMVILAAGWSAGFATRIVCYYANWSRYDESKFKVEDIDPTLCTHIVYAFYGLDEEGKIVSRDVWNDVGDEWNEGGLTRFLKLKNRNPSVKLLLGVGGWNEGPLNFINMAKSAEKRKIFLDSCLKFLQYFKFDGIEIDWLYTDSWGGSESDKNNYSRLVMEMKENFQKRGYVLGVATSASLTVVRNSFDIQALSKYADYVYVMTYDYHGSWEKKTHHAAPLYERDELNINATISAYLNDFGGIPEKLNLGIVNYGRNFTLKTKGCTDYEADVAGAKFPDTIPYWKFCADDKKGVWTKFKYEAMGIPYAVAGYQWLGYEDAKYLTEKVKYAKSKKLGGISFWKLDFDDFRGNCGTGRYPLLTAVRTEMLK